MRSRFRPNHATVVAYLALFIALGAIAGWLAIGGGQASAAQVGCGDTITTDTKLDSNLTNCPNNGIVIGANGVTLNLNGHRIDGDGTPAVGCDPETEFCDIGVVNDGHDGVTIEGGKLREFGFGVFTFRARKNRLRNLWSSRDSVFGVFIVKSTHSRIKKSSFARNGISGIVMSESSHNRIERNSATRNGLSSVFLIEADHNRIERNVLRRNGADGIEALESSRNRIARNSASRNEGNGMIIEGNHNRIKRNHLSRNQDGVIVTGNHNAIARNRVARAGGFGISFEGGHGNLIARNLVLSSSRAGIRLSLTRRQLEGDPGAVDTVVRRNRLERGNQDGVLVMSTAKDTLLRRNRARRSKQDGFDVNSPATTLRRNLAVHNGDLGIEAVSGVTDGGGNRAHGNGDPRQCKNIVCT